MVSIPDPDRYQFIDDGPRRGWLDTLDGRDLFFSFDIVVDMLKKAGNLPVSALSPLISDAPSYVRSRADAIVDELNSGVQDRVFRNITNEELATLADREEFFVIVSIDLIGSTILSQSVDAKLWARIIQVYSSEVARLCVLFHGRPLKYMGDGVLLYFHDGSAIRRHDLASDCALSLRDLVLLGINPALKKLGLPEIGCRIGVDSGDAYVMTIGDSGTTNQMDIIGHTVDIATKVEKRAGVNEICIGEAAKRKLHTMWLKHAVPLSLPTDWPYRDEGSGEPYGVYRLDIPTDLGA
jgi:class 3 adenylate cyclase